MTIKIGGAIGAGGGGGGGITFSAGTSVGDELVRTGATTVGSGNSIATFTTKVNGGAAASANVQESGTDITAITWDWTYSGGNPVSQTLTLVSAVNISNSPASPGLITPVTVRTKALSGLTMDITAAPTSTTTKSTYRLSTVFLSGGPTVTANSTIQYQNRRYFGVAPEGTIITTGAAAFAAFSSSAEFCTGTAVTKTFDCSAGTPPNRMYICWPASFADPASVVVGGFSVSNYTINTSSLTNASGFAENYKILVVPNDGSGTSSASITVQLT